MKRFLASLTFVLVCLILKFLPQAIEHLWDEYQGSCAILLETSRVAGSEGLAISDITLHRIGQVPDSGILTVSSARGILADITVIRDQTSLIKPSFYGRRCPVMLPRNNPQTDDDFCLNFARSPKRSAFFAVVIRVQGLSNYYTPTYEIRESRDRIEESTGDLGFQYEPQDRQPSKRACAVREMSLLDRFRLLPIWIVLLGAVILFVVLSAIHGGLGRNRQSEQD